MRPPDSSGLGMFLHGDDRFSHVGAAASFFSILTASTKDGTGTVIMTASNASPFPFKLLRAISDEHGWTGFRQPAGNACTGSQAASNTLPDQPPCITPPGLNWSGCESGQAKARAACTCKQQRPAAVWGARQAPEQPWPARPCQLALAAGAWRPSSPTRTSQARFGYRFPLEPVAEGREKIWLMGEIDTGAPTARCATSPPPMMQASSGQRGEPRSRLREGPGRTPSPGIAGPCLPRPHGKAGNQAAMIMAECHKGMARQIRNATFTLVDRGS